MPIEGIGHRQTTGGHLGFEGLNGAATRYPVILKALQTGRFSSSGKALVTRTVTDRRLRAPVGLLSSLLIDTLHSPGWRSINARPGRKKRLWGGEGALCR